MNSSAIGTRMCGQRSPATQRVLQASLLLCMLTACGGGDDNPPALPRSTAPPATVAAPAPSPAPRAQLLSGVFGGTLQDEQTFDMLYVVMRDGTKVGYFGADWPNAFQFAGYWVSTDSAWGWTSPDGTISGSFNGGYRGEPAFVVTTFDMAIPTLTGSIKAGQFTTRTATFAGGSISASAYVFNGTASAALVAGAWELADSAGNALKLEVFPDGVLKGIYRGCTLTGAMKPSAGGENAFVVSFDFDTPVRDCQPDLENSLRYIGFAIALPLNSGRTRLIAFVSSSDGWNWMTIGAVGQR